MYINKKSSSVPDLTVQSTKLDKYKTKDLDKLNKLKNEYKLKVSKNSRKSISKSKDIDQLDHFMSKCTIALSPKCPNQNTHDLDNANLDDSDKMDNNEIIQSISSFNEDFFNLNNNIVRNKVHISNKENNDLEIKRGS